MAAGEGTRLRSLTTAASGATIPKQFCSLYAGPSLLHEALIRAQTVAAHARTCAVVAEQHRKWWTESLHCLAASNVIVQPENRGTANGILLPLLHILERDPGADIVLLPSDHHVRQETVLGSALYKAAEQLQWRLDETVLLGLQPEDADPELGYIAPGRSDGRGALTVERFVEKPSATQAQELILSGALWNAFIVVSRAQTLLGMFRRCIPEIVSQMRAAVRADLRTPGQAIATTEFYRTLPTIDFSRDVLPGHESSLRVLPVAPCGWSDLGTPRRVAEALRRNRRPEAVARMREGLAHLSLATQHERLLGQRA